MGNTNMTWGNFRTPDKSTRPSLFLEVRRLRLHPLQEEEEPVQGADLEVVAGRARPQHVGQLERDVLQAVRQDLLREVGEERALTGSK